MSRDEIDELIIYISDFKRNFNRKLDDHLFIIQQQNKRIDEQNCVIDELAWQLRDLRDSVRQLSLIANNNNNNNNNGKSGNFCVCNYENHIPRNKKKLETNFNKFDKNKNKNDRQLAILDKLSNESSGEENLYEPVEFNTKIKQQENKDKIQSLPTTQLMTRYGRIEQQQQQPSRNKKIIENYQKTTQVPSTRQPNYKLTKKNDDGAIGGGVGGSGLVGSQSLKEKKSTFEFPIYDEVVLRTRNFKTFASNSQRGSSKNVSSLISNIEDEYLPKSIEISEEDNISQISYYDDEDAADYREIISNPNSQQTDDNYKYNNNRNGGNYQPNGIKRIK